MVFLSDAKDNNKKYFLTLLCVLLKKIQMIENNTKHVHI